MTRRMAHRGMFWVIGLVALVAMVLATDYWSKEAGAQEPAAVVPPQWEYKVVEAWELVGRVAQQLTPAADEAGGDQPVLQDPPDAEERAKAAHATEAVLNEYGAEGWQLAAIANNQVVLMRPRAR